MIILPGTIHRYTLFGDISVDNPSVLFATSSSQNFAYQPRPREWITGYADDWGRWGHQAMPRQLLRAPDAGTFPVPAYAVASGEAYLVGASVGSTVGISIYQNSFGLVNGSVQSASFALATTNVVLAVGTTVNWQLVCGAQSNFNGGPGYTTQIQLSVGVIVVQAGDGIPEIKMYQFEFQN